MDIERLIEGLKTCARLGDSPIMDGFAVIADKRKLEDAALAIETLRTDLAHMTAELADCREKNAGLALALLFECAPNPDVAEKPAIEDILKVVFQPGYDVVTIYNPPDEDGLCTMTATGVISKEEYEAALKARE